MLALEIMSPDVDEQKRNRDKHSAQAHAERGGSIRSHVQLRDFLHPCGEQRVQAEREQNVSAHVAELRAGLGGAVQFLVLTLSFSTAHVRGGIRARQSYRSAVRMQIEKRLPFYATTFNNFTALCANAVPIAAPARTSLRRCMPSKMREAQMLREHHSRAADNLG